jgi:hypothetical protein
MHFPDVYAAFNFPTILLMSHWVEQIQQYGALEQYSAERHDQAHETNLKDSCNSYHHNLNWLPHAITFQHSLHFFIIRELYDEFLDQRRENSTATCIFHPSSADLDATLSVQSCAKPEVMGSQNHRDWKHPDSKIKDLGALLQNR